MSRSTYTGTTFDAMIKGGLPTLTGQGADQFPAFAPAPKAEVLYTVPQLGAYLHVGERPIYKWIAEGSLVASWVGRAHLISESNLVAFLKNQEKVSSSHRKGKATAEVQ